MQGFKLVLLLWSVWNLPL